MYLFYVPNIAHENVLTPEESQHCVKVLRLAVGDKILLTDGVGGIYEAQITYTNPKRCEFEVINKQEEVGKRPFRLHVAIAPTKNIDRLEWMIEKCTEIGIDEITPLLCRFSERKVIKPERLHKVMVSAAKQSLKAYVPKLNELTTFADLIANATEPQKFIAHCYKDEKKLLQHALQPKQDMLILIGPEGDFSEEEVAKALQAGFVPVSLGSSRLRTETAGVVACHTAAIVNEE